MAKCLEGLDYVLISKAGETGTIVMQVSYPHIVGRLVFIDQRNPEDIEPFMRSMANGDVLAKLKGYSIFVLPGGTLDRATIDPERTRAVLKEMAGYVLDEILPVRLSRYRRFQERVNLDEERRRPRIASRFGQEEE